MSNDTKKAWFEQKNESFLPATPDMDLLHPEARDAEPGAELTETQYLGFNIPEENIHGVGYLWHHPNLGVVSGGVYAWRGVKENNLECELFDVLTFVDDECLSGDLTDYTLPNSYHGNVLEPLRRHRIRYADEARGNSLDIEFEAIMDPMVTSSGQHLEQAMRTRGQLTLAGRTYEMDSYTVRDRSWGSLRSEKHANQPPFAWMNGVAGPHFAFQTTAYDHPDSNPDWKGLMEIPGGGDATLGGWVMNDNELTAIVSSVKSTRRNPRTHFPESVEMTLTDANGKVYELRGTVTAASNWRVWPHIDAIVCQTRWECDGQVFYGDIQDNFRHDYIRRMAEAREATGAGGAG